MTAKKVDGMEGIKMSLDGKKTAIVLIETQNEFLTPGGAMNSLIQEQLLRRHVVENMQNLVSQARGRVAKIIYIPFHSFEPGSSDVKECGPAYQGLRRTRVANWGKKSWLKGTTGPEIIDQLKPQKCDIVVEGKITLDAFQSTAIDYLLRANEIETVAFAGVLTNWCIESSVRSAYDRGYRVIVIGDCTAAETQEEQDYAERHIFPKISLVIDHKEFLEALE
jgi:nicotinamidase-related amidase